MFEICDIINQEYCGRDVLNAEYFLTLDSMERSFLRHRPNESDGWVLVNKIYPLSEKQGTHPWAQYWVLCRDHCAKIIPMGGKLLTFQTIDCCLNG